MKARKGVTLIEVMLAGAITVLFTLSLMEGLIVAAKISNENSQLLAADAWAWDTAWRWFNKKYDDLNAGDAGVYIYGNLSSNACPTLCREMTGANAVWAVKVSSRTEICHGVEVSGKLIEVDLAWGPGSERKSLNGMFNGEIEHGTRTYSRPISIWKCKIDRGAQ